MTGRARYDRTVPGLAALLHQQRGLARRSQLRALGVTDGHVRSQLAARRWQLVAPEVVSTDNGLLDRGQLLWRAVLHASTGWLGGRSALEVRGLRGYEPEQVHVLVPMDARPARLRGVQVHVTRRLPGLSTDGLPGFLPLAPLARSVVDAASWSPHPRLAMGVLVAALQQGLVLPREVDAELEAAGRIRHKVAIRAVLADAVGGGESVSEIDLGPLLRRAGLPRFRRQVQAPGRRSDVEVDLPDGSVLVIEVDGPTHDTPEGRWRDSERDAGVAADGKLLLRLPTYAIRFDPDGVVRRLVRIRTAAERRRDSR
ncbi:MAG TPA: hypothetical protein VFL59_02675 [Candidatus Nanopelagicales bacterium]|nr:hypothetical protein [Candidatus Nanopelagicales bacterium]